MADSTCIDCGALVPAEACFCEACVALNRHLAKEVTDQMNNLIHTPATGVDAEDY